MRGLAKERRAGSVLLCALFSTVMVVATTGTAKAHHLEGVVYCDDNENRAIDPGTDSILEGVCVNVVSTDAGTVDSTDCTDIPGFWKEIGEYWIGLPSIRPSTYKAMLVSGLPADATFVIPATNEHLFVIEDGHIVEIFDWLIDSEICHPPEPYCGDGILDEGESCDPPDSVPDDAYPDNLCRDDCTYCGDGIRDEGEECDFMEPDIENCNTDCTVVEPYCGDGILDEGETCDPPDSIPDDAYPENECREDCTYCGDGIRDESEECDFMEPDIENCDADCTWSGGDQGCTPGYWKQEHHFDSWVGYVPGYPGDTPEPSLFSDVFGIVIEIKWKDPEENGKPQPTEDPTLLQALEANGGGVNELARHAVAALLSLSNPDVDYPLSWEEILDAVEDGDAGTLVEANELGCPLNNSSPASTGEDSAGSPGGEISGIAACSSVTGAADPNAKDINLQLLILAFGAVFLHKRLSTRR